MSLVLAVLGALRAALKTRTDLTLENPRRNGLYVREHQLVGLHAEPELPAQHLQAEAALAQRSPEGTLRFQLHQDARNLFDVELKYVQDLRGDASDGLAHHDLHRPALLVHQGSNPLSVASCSQRTRGHSPPESLSVFVRHLSDYQLQVHVILLVRPVLSAWCREFTFYNRSPSSGLGRTRAPKARDCAR